MFGTLHNNENGFDIVTLDEVCSLIKDGTHQTPQYTENRIEGYKFLSSKDVMSQKIDWTDIKYIPEELHKKLYAVIRPQRNDILMSKNGVNYGVAAVNDTDEIFDIYVSLALLRPKAVIDPVFLRCIINNPETKKQLVNGYMENVVELQKPPFDKPISFIKLFDTKTRASLLKTINDVKDNAVNVIA